MVEGWGGKDTTAKMSLQEINKTQLSCGATRGVDNYLEVPTCCNECRCPLEQKLAENLTGAFTNFIQRLTCSRWHLQEIMSPKTSIKAHYIQLVYHQVILLGHCTETIAKMML